MKARIGGPNFQSSAATRKNRAARASAEATQKIRKSSPVSPERMVMTL